jgi:hypothetical protein
MMVSYVGSGACFVSGKGSIGVPFFGLIGTLSLKLALWQRGKEKSAIAEIAKLTAEIGEAEGSVNSVATRTGRLLDADYQTIPLPLPRSMLGQPISAGDGVSSEVAAAANALATTGGQIVSFDEAELTAINRAESAYEAGDETWQDRQLDAAKQYAVQESNLLATLPGELNALDAGLTASGFRSVSTPNGAAFAQANVATNGLPAQLTDMVVRLGTTAEDQQAAQQLFLDTPASSVMQVSSGLISRVLQDALTSTAISDAAGLLNDFGRPQPNTGVAVAPGAATHQLQVTLTARDALCSPNAQLQSLKVTGLANAQVIVPGVGTIAAPSATPVAIPNQPSSIVITVQKLQAGQPATVRLVVHDGCGDWPTFVGGGANAF